LLCRLGVTQRTVADAEPAEPSMLVVTAPEGGVSSPETA